MYGVHPLLTCLKPVLKTLSELAPWMKTDLPMQAQPGVAHELLLLKFCFCVTAEVAGTSGICAACLLQEHSRCSLANGMCRAPSQSNKPVFAWHLSRSACVLPV